MAIFRALVGGVLGGVAAALGWAYLAHNSGAELGVFAWLVGIIVGVCVSLVTGRRVDLASGGVAAMLAVGAVVGGRLATSYLDTQADAERIRATASSEEFLVSWVAIDVKNELNKAGQTLVWPADASKDQPVGRKDFPENVWQEATTRWSSFSENEKAEYRDLADRSSRLASSSLPVFTFFATFSLLDGLWMMLALGSAFKLGAMHMRGGGGRVEVNPEAASAVLSAFYIPVPDGATDVHFERAEKADVLEEETVTAA